MEKEESRLLQMQTGPVIQNIILMIEKSRNMKLLQMCRFMCATGRPRNPWMLRERHSVRAETNASVNNDV